MSELVARGPEIAPMSSAAIDRVRRMESMALAMPQVSILTDHVLHAGMYARTVFVPAGVMITGVLVKVPTILILHGNALIYVGDDMPMPCAGYNVLTAAAGRKQAFLAETDICLTMIFPSDATTVEEAEQQFTDESDLLQSRQETPCQA